MQPPRAQRRGLGWGYLVAAKVIPGILRLLARRDWRGGEHLPATGGAVVVANHATYLDAVTAGHWVWGHGRVLRYLVKSGLFRTPVFGAVLRSAQQIPVYREGPDAAQAYRAAVEAVRRGEVVLVFPEGTLTRDPGLWPMRGKTGAARIALATGCPVIPLGQWGASDILPRYRRLPRPWPRRTVRVWAGAPVDLADLHGREDRNSVAEATDRIMAAIVGIVADQRGEQPPAQLYDPRAHGVAETGRIRPDRD
jgi:1-acyl-sn-glycerol-3-phosphate acyltransferase